MDYVLQLLTRYGDDRVLTLYPRDPLPPHGLPDLPEIASDGHFRNFDYDKVFASEELAEIKILKPIKRGIDSGAQLFLCEVLKAPTPTQPEGQSSSYKPFDAGMKMVLKVFDPMLFPPVEKKPPMCGKQAEPQLSREAKALRHLYDKGLTGHPHLAPQYHGSWAIKFKRMYSNEMYWDYVGAILMEYIEGVSMESMCDRESMSDRDEGESENMSDSDGEIVCMVPKDKKAFLRFPSPSDDKHGQSFVDVSARLQVLRTLLDGCVSFMHAGIELNTFLPENIFITLGNNGVNLEEPRVVFLDYSHCVVWSDTETSSKGRADEYDSLLPKLPSKYLLDKHPLERLRLPPHPAWKFNTSNLFHFAGWFPSGWMSHEDRLKAWLVSEFGAADKGYSTYYDLVQVMEEAIKDAKSLYFEENPDKDEADLERGDRTLMRSSKWEEKEERLAAKEKNMMTEFEAKLLIRDKERAEKMKSQVDQPKRTKRHALSIRRKGGKPGGKQHKDGGHGGDERGGASASNVGEPTRTSSKHQRSPIDDDEYGSGDGGGEILESPKKRQNRGRGGGAGRRA
ncbi:hypothetical protein LX32DRAFT_594635 [Colletotrichum zoysiae]|uniref:Protein kinase domain-containing protein n=1 Tax=Colletotrichum zoysiae TaxID=1216348 RepID=A0AAD9LZ96_9PEZI|nr:hypothetical protein LX32DRAFT_594635 [Colletotrichum zoysiae]